MAHDVLSTEARPPTDPRKSFPRRFVPADADLGRPFSILQRDPRIDLGGWTYQFTVGWRFGN